MSRHVRFGLGLICAIWLSHSVEAGESSGRVARGLTMSLAPSLAGDSSWLEQAVDSARHHVLAWFQAAGLKSNDTTLIDSVVVFTDLASARSSLASSLGVQEAEIPETFAGTVISRTLYLVSQPAYRPIWEQLYPNWPWTDRTYRGLIVHELAHRAHEAIAIAQFGSADAMGPGWFFEGLAVACAGQFGGQADTLSRVTISGRVHAGTDSSMSYVEYGQWVRSLARVADWGTLITSAALPGFPDSLRSSGNTPSDH